MVAGSDRRHRCPQMTLQLKKCLVPETPEGKQYAYRILDNDLCARLVDWSVGCPLPMCHGARGE